MADEDAAIISAHRRAVGLLRCYRNGDIEGCEALIIDAFDQALGGQLIGCLVQLADKILSGADNPDAWLEEAALHMAFVEANEQG